MRRAILATIGATLAIAGATTTLVTPAGGPYFSKLDPAARFTVKIDNTGDGIEDVAYRWRSIRLRDGALSALARVDAPAASAQLKVEGDQAMLVAGASAELELGDDGSPILA
jgi:hypothetical protein